MTCLLTGQEQPARLSRTTRHDPLTLHFCDEENRPACAKNPRRRHDVSSQGPDIRTPHVSHAPRASVQNARNPISGNEQRTALRVPLENWDPGFEICAPKTCSRPPRLHSRPEPEIDFDPRSQRRLWVWTDAIPQRNCGRISRPSPIPQMNKEQRILRQPTRPLAGAGAMPPFSGIASVTCARSGRAGRRAREIHINIF